MLHPVRPVEYEVTAAGDALGVTLVHGCDDRPLRQALTGAGRLHGPCGVLLEPVDGESAAVHDDRSQLGVVAYGEARQVNRRLRVRRGHGLGGVRGLRRRRLGVRGPGRGGQPDAPHALALGITRGGILSEAVHRPSGDGQLLATVQPGHRAGSFVSTPAGAIPPADTGGHALAQPPSQTDFAGEAESLSKR